MAKKVRTKAKKKIWIQLVAPKIFNEQVLGEIPLLEPSSAIGRHVTVNLMTLTRDMRKQNTNVQFEITEVKGSRAHTKMLGLRVMPAAVKRLMRRNKSKVDESFVVQTKDDVYITPKPLLVTTSATHKSVLTVLRSKVREILALECKKMDYDKLIIDIISNNMQRGIKDKLKKIHPLRICEIRSMKIVNPERIKYVKVVEAKPEPPKPVEEPKKEAVVPEAAKA